DTRTVEVRAAMHVDRATRGVPAEAASFGTRAAYSLTGAAGEKKNAGGAGPDRPQRLASLRVRARLQPTAYRFFNFGVVRLLHYRISASCLANRSTRPFSSAASRRWRPTSGSPRPSSWISSGGW